MSDFIASWLICFVLVFPTWLVGAVENMANAGDLLWTAGFAAFLALIFRLSRRGNCPRTRRPT